MLNGHDRHFLLKVASLSDKIAARETAIGRGHTTNPDVAECVHAARLALLEEVKRIASDNREEESRWLESFRKEQTLLKRLERKKKERRLAKKKSPRR